MTAVVNFTQIRCFKCDVLFCMPDTLYTQRLEDHRDFWCPNGHQQHFTGTREVDQQRERADAAERSRDFWRTQAQEKERALVGQRAATTRAKNKLKRVKVRVAHGVCPCCKRTFVALGRHMATKHPDYDAT